MYLILALAHTNSSSLGGFGTAAVRIDPCGSYGCSLQCLICVCGAIVEGGRRATHTCFDHITEELDVLEIRPAFRSSRNNVSAMQLHCLSPSKGHKVLPFLFPFLPSSFPSFLLASCAYILHALDFLPCSLKS